jgi:hypothetical protein
VVIEILFALLGATSVWDATHKFSVQEILCSNEAGTRHDLEED